MCNIFDVDFFGVCFSPHFAGAQYGATLLKGLRPFSFLRNVERAFRRRRKRGVAPECNSGVGKPRTKFNVEDIAYHVLNYIGFLNMKNAVRHALCVARGFNHGDQMPQPQNLSVGKAYVMPQPCSELHRLLLTEKFLPN